jgi:phosphate transport system protein
MISEIIEIMERRAAMRSKFDEQLLELNKEMIEMGNKIVQSIKNAIEALIARDEKMARAIMEGDVEIDHLQKKIEGICFNLLIQQQPVARDLRNVTAAMKMVTDMERIGDHAADISEMTILMGQGSQIDKFEHISKMATETMIMLNHSIEAYVEKDVIKAKEVIEHDDVVDDLFVEAKKDVIKLILNNPGEGEEATDILMIAKYFERIGDHATNIAEWVIFSLKQKEDADEV